MFKAHKIVDVKWCNIRNVVSRRQMLFILIHTPLPVGYSYMLFEDVIITNNVHVGPISNLLMKPCYSYLISTLFDFLEHFPALYMLD